MSNGFSDPPFVELWCQSNLSFHAISDKFILFLNFRMTLLIIVHHEIGMLWQLNAKIRFIKLEYRCRISVLFHWAENSSYPCLLLLSQPFSHKELADSSVPCLYWRYISLFFEVRRLKAWMRTRITFYIYVIGMNTHFHGIGMFWFISSVIKGIYNCLFKGFLGILRKRWGFFIFRCHRNEIHYLGDLMVNRSLQSFQSNFTVGIVYLDVCLCSSEVPFRGFTEEQQRHISRS